MSFFHYEQELMQRVQVPQGAEQRVFARTFLSPRTRGRWAPLVFATGALAVFVLAFMQSPVTPQGEGSFLSIAHAAYENVLTTYDAAFPVHYTKTRTTFAGAVNRSEPEIREQWILVGEGRTLIFTDKYDVWVETENGNYVSPEHAAWFAPSTGDGDDEHATTIYSDDIAHLGSSQYVLAMPDTIASYAAIDPENSDVVCYDFIEKTEAQKQQQEFMSTLRAATGFEAHEAPRPLHELMDLLAQGEREGRVEDLGTYVHEEKMLRWFRSEIVWEIEGMFQGKEIITFGFNPETYTLEMMIFVAEDPEGSQVTFTTTFLEDRFVAREDAHPALLDPQGEGLVLLVTPANHPENLPVIELEEAGCYRETFTTFERLSPEDETAAHERAFGEGLHW